MPKELKSKEELLKIAKERGRKVIVKKTENGFKVKVRTPKYLFTIKLSSENEVNDLIRQLNLPVERIQ